MTQLSDREIEEAAREAGISPAELRSALADQRRQGSSALVPTHGGAGMLPPSVRGRSSANAETTLPYPAEQAVRAVKAQIEREVGGTGHMQGSTEADVYDEPNGIVYRIQAADDGGGGSLVRVDIDATPMRSRRVLSSMGIGATAGLFFLAGVVIPGLLGTALAGGAIGLAVLTVLGMTTSRSRAIKDARATTARALVEAEHGASVGTGALGDPYGDPDLPRALPPAGRT